MKHLQRWLHALLLALAIAGFGGAAGADFTESEDHPFLDPDQSEDDPLSAAEPVPWDLAAFETTFGNGAMLIRGSLDAGDVDAYAFDFATGALVLSHLFEDGDGERNDTQLGVFTGGAAPPLASDDDSAAGFLSGWTHEVASGGVHQIGVTGFGDAAWDGSHEEAEAGLVPYYLLVAATTDPPPLQESEGNGTVAAADPLPDGGGVVGATLGAGDIDHFEIALEEGDRLALAVFDLETGSFTAAGGERNDTQLAVIAPGGGVAAESDDDGQGFLSHLLFTVPPGQGGVWTIAVTGFGDDDLDGSHQEGPFDYLLAVARDRACPDVAPLISGIVASTPNSYVTAELQGGDHYYTDRTDAGRHVLVDVPAPFECGEWIKTANNDKNVSAANHLTFDLSQDASVFIGYDTRATGEPAWLASGFTPLPHVIDVADPDPIQEFDVLRRDFHAGSVVLGGNLAPGAGSNYVVLALPLDLEDPAHALAIPHDASLVSVTIAGVLIEVARQPGWTAEDLAQAVAAAVNANATLMAARIFAIASGATLVTTGTIEDSQITRDIPALPAWSALLLAALLGVGARRARRVAREAAAERGIRVRRAN